MKLYFLIFLIHLQILITFGQVFDQGRIISDDGLCLTAQNNGASFLNCEPNNPGQIFNFNIGSDSLPTFKAINGQSVFVNSTCGTDPNQLFTFQSTSSSTDKVTFNVNEIPMVTGRFLDSLGINAPRSLYKGFIFKIGGYNLRLDADCVLRVRSPGYILWASSEAPSYCAPSALLILQTDGNLCIYPHETNPNPVWCSGPVVVMVDISHLFHRFLMEEFGIVITEAKYQMVWGRFGQTLFLDAVYALIPGSYLDKLNPNKNTLYSNQFITNGRDYLVLGQDGILRLNQKNFLPNPSLKWNTNKPTSSQVGPYSFKIQEDSNVCVKSSVATQDAIFCTGIQSNNARYVHIPILENNREFYPVPFWGWVTYDTNSILSFAQFGSPDESFIKKFTNFYPLRNEKFGVYAGSSDLGHIYTVERDTVNGGFLAYSILYNTTRRLGNDIGISGYCKTDLLNDIIPGGYSFKMHWSNTSFIITATPELGYCYEWLETPSIITVAEIVVGPTLQYAVATLGYNSFFLLDDNGKMLYHFDL
ncbi:hypothetical protein ACTA71_010699 [Dictyostelium dimigraforme]